MVLKLLYLAHWSILNWLLYMVWGRGSTSFFCFHIICCPSIICWRDCSFKYFLCTILLLDSVYCSIDLFLYLYHTVIRASVKAYRLQYIPTDTSWLIILRLSVSLRTREKVQFQSLSWEDPLEEGKATHSSILAWSIPWTEEPGGLQGVAKSPKQTEMT